MDRSDDTGDYRTVLYSTVIMTSHEPLRKKKKPRPDRYPRQVAQYSTCTVPGIVVLNKIVRVIN